MTTTLPYTEFDEANRQLAEDPLSLLIGLVLYQQVPLEKAFVGPYVLRQRLGGTMTADMIASADPGELDKAFRERPALHRFPGNMAKRVQALAAHIVDEYEGDASRLWSDVDDAGDLLARLVTVPGFGEYKARILAGILAGRFGVRPEGWEKLLPDWPSVADVATFEDVAVLKERKKAWKESGGEGS